MFEKWALQAKGSPREEFCMAFVVVGITMNNYSSFLGSNCSSVTSSKVWPEHPEQRAPCLLPVAQHSSLRWEWRGVTLGTLAGGMLSHLQTTKRSAHWWSQASQRSFLMCSTRQPPMHPTLSSCPRWDPADPPELRNLGCKTQTCCHGSVCPLSFWAPGRLPGSTPLSPKQIPLWSSASQGVVCRVPTGRSQGGMLKMQIPHPCARPIALHPQWTLGKMHLMVTFLNEYTWFMLLAEVCKHLSVSDFSHPCFFFSSTSVSIAHKSSQKEQDWRL